MRPVFDGRWIFILLILLLNQANGLERRPWFYSPYELHIGAALEGSWFSTVNHGFNPIDYHSNNIQLQGYLIVPFAPMWEAELELELERTSKRSFGFESLALEVRNQLLNDITGDWFSLDVAGNIRFVPTSRLKDVAVPYHNLVNFEIAAALGREFDSQGDWFARGFLFAALGQANRGFPWIRSTFEVEAKVLKQSIFRGFIYGYFGLGNRVGVNVNQFHSYANIAHRSIDVGASYSYIFDIWGKMTLQYSYRPYARSFPERLQAVKLAYDLPFSF